MSDRKHLWLAIIMVFISTVSCSAPASSPTATQVSPTPLSVPIQPTQTPYYPTASHLLATVNTPVHPTATPYYPPVWYLPSCPTGSLLDIDGQQINVTGRVTYWLHVKRATDGAIAVWADSSPISGDSGPHVSMIPDNILDGIRNECRRVQGG